MARTNRRNLDLIFFCLAIAVMIGGAIFYFRDIFRIGNYRPIDFSLAIQSVSFHREHSDGPVNAEKVFELGDKVFMNVVVGWPKKKKSGEINLSEGLTIFDENNQVVLENKNLVTMNKIIDSTSVTFQNNALLPNSGVFKFVISITDLYSKKVVTAEESVTVNKGSGLKIVDFNFKADSPDGLTRKPAEYILGETVFVTFDLMGITNQGGKISFNEDLYVTDENDTVLLEKKGILQANEPWDAEDLISLHNEVSVPKVGKYKIKIVVTDRLSKTKSEKSERFEVKEEAQ